MGKVGAGRSSVFSRLRQRRVLVPLLFVVVVVVVVVVGVVVVEKVGLGCGTTIILSLGGSCGNRPRHSMNFLNRSRPLPLSAVASD